MNTVVTIKMGDMRTLTGSGQLETAGVGSCVAIIIYDPVAKVGGMAHVLLPTADRDAMPMRYVDRSIPALIAELCSKGAQRDRLLAKLVGGSHMFSLYGDADHSIGHRNIEAAHRMLEEEKIPLVGEETGGTVGRNVRFDIETGICSVETKL